MSIKKTLLVVALAIMAITAGLYGLSKAVVAQEPRKEATVVTRVAQDEPAAEPLFRELTLAFFEQYNVHMIRFEWDPAKAVRNVRKHGVSFEEASTAFTDPFARVILDPDHSEAEDRFILLGLSMAARTLVVCHCYRDEDEVIRIVSARKANGRERKQYGRFL